MSGIASAASTMPGSVATFWSCSSERSRRIAARISSSAKTRAGTRMSGRASAGISYSASSIRRRSNVKDDMRAPATSLSSELQAMVRHGLDDRPRRANVARDDGVERISAEVELRHALGNEALGVGEEDELLQPPREQVRAVDAAQLDHVARPLVALPVVQLGQRGECLAEDLLLVVGVHLEREL